MGYHKHLKPLITSVLIVMLLSFLGCATIFKGSSADVRVNSSPAGADIFINEIDKGTTPQTLSLKRNKDYLLTFKKDGYKDVKVEVNKKFDIGTTVIGNIFSWGIIGIIVDLAGGAAYSLTPADVEANMDNLAKAGYLPTENEMKESDIHVILLTKEEWAEISK